MENLGKLLNCIMHGMQKEVDVYGHDISLWQIYMFVIVASILAAFIGGIFRDE